MNSLTTCSNVLITLRGDKYELIFDFAAIREAEELTGASIVAGISAKEVNAPRLSLVQAMLYAGTRRNHSKLSYAEVAGLVTLGNYLRIWGSVLKAWVACMALAREEEKNQDPT